MAIKVYLDQELIFEGSFREVAEYIGVSRITLYHLRYGVATHLPRKAICDYVEIDGVRFDKKPLPEPKKRSFEVGFKIVIRDETYEITDLKEVMGNYIYTINNEFQVRALKPFESYNSLYQSIQRRLKRLGKW